MGDPNDKTAARGEGGRAQRPRLFEKSAHCAHLEVTEKYNRTVADFLKGTERG